ncbi:hypothetical protein K388_05614 [Streptomyces sp. KhCrAH-43]|uniref:hypothetical protein n=1 Tax=unclassified Streptomyces TaxID=2593676 RepID=UPI00035D8AE9|nr:MULTISPECIES: hypothetical protein [unclassified Streptomyces]MYX67331.1 hypothetical protein [Streptomyces sp. SID8373]RAJ53827.1 hypothetical protein K388_05614 [Streptomyces sp. KhCrAH-43]
MEQPKEQPKPLVRVATNTSSFIEGIQKFRSAVLFAYHDDLVELDDELDILYRGQM